MGSAGDQIAGNCPESFTLLPEGKSRSGAFLAAIVVECVVCLLILAIPTRPFPEISAGSQLSELVFHAAREVKQPEPRPRIAMNPPRVEREESPALTPPRPEILRRRVRVAKVPMPTPTFHAPAARYRSIEPPAPAIHTGVLAPSVAAPTLPRALPTVKTGGFGDPMGVAATGKTPSTMIIAHVGSFNAPIGPGKGTDGVPSGRGATARAGFGSVVAVSGAGGNRPSSGRIREGGFSDQATIPVARAAAPREAKPSVQPVKILEKPDPVYTAEARAKKIEGNVVLEVIFGASGTVRVLRVVRGLGYGLDEAAVSAAERIRFRPERVDGKPVDERARLRIVFRLAY